MTQKSEMLARPPATAERRRRTVRYFLAAVAALTAMMYFLIGLGVAVVADVTPADDPSLFSFGLSAGLAFALGALLLLVFDRRVLWLLGALLQVSVIVMYVVVAEQRVPPFETWGILIKVAQVTILAGLIYLIVRPSARAFA